MGSLSLLQWIFLTQESNQGVLHYRQIPYQLSYQGRQKEEGACPLSTQSGRPDGEVRLCP